MHPAAPCLAKTDDLLDLSASAASEPYEVKWRALLLRIRIELKANHIR
jgi:hypothetical protein